MRTVSLALSAVVLCSASAQAQMKNTSFRDAQGHRVQQLEVVVAAPVAKVWDAFTTDKGFTGWAVPVAHITLGNDGMMESSYLPAAKIGDPDNIRNQIVAYVPERLLVIHNVHVPKGAPFKPEIIDKIRTVVELEDLGDGRTRIVESGVGYGEGADFDAMYKHFSDGNAEEFGDLVKYLASGPVDWKTELAGVAASVKK
jgi:uncharacterized protein YndB with AHSA1/START domain